MGSALAAHKQYLNGLVVSARNVQVQYLQKIALRAKNPFGPKWSHYLDMLYFLHEVQFFAGIGPAHFPAGGTAIEVLFMCG